MLSYMFSSRFSTGSKTLVVATTNSNEAYTTLALIISSINSFVHWS